MKLSKAHKFSKGKAPMRSVADYPYSGEPGQFGFDSGWQTSKAFS